MDDLNEMATQHTSGATVRHVSPFESLPSYKNKGDLSAEFLSE